MSETNNKMSTSATPETPKTLVENYVAMMNETTDELPPPATSEAPKSILIKALEENDLDSFRIALENGENISSDDDPKTGLTIFEMVLNSKNSNLHEFITLCIEYGADKQMINANGANSIHLVADSAHPETLKRLLTHYTPDELNMTFKGENCLHILANKLIKKDMFSEQTSLDNITECMRILLKRGCDPNMVNENTKKTPFYILLKAQKSHGEKNILQSTLTKISQKLHDEEKVVLEKMRKLVEFFIEYSKIEFGEDEKLQQLFKELDPDLQIPDWTKRENYFDFLFNELMTKCNEIRFKNHFEIFKARNSNGEWNDARFIYKAVDKNVEGIVKFLIDEGIDVDEEKYNDKPVAFIAVEHGSHKVLKMLLEKSELKLKTSFGGKTLLLVVCKKFAAKNCPPGNQKCFNLVMEHCTYIDVNAQDKLNNNALYYAACSHNVKAQKMLLEKGSYIGMIGTVNYEVPIQNIDKNVLEDHLDDCVTTDVKTAGDDDDEEDIIVDFSFLIHPENRNDDKLVLDMDPLKTIMDNKKLHKLISHPVLQTVVHLKWRKFQNWFMLNLMFFLFFLMISFIGFIAIEQPELRKFFQVTTTIGLIALIIREAFQLFHSGFTDYFDPICSYINYLEIFLICVAIRVLYFIDANDTSAESQTMKISTIVLVSYEMMQLLNPLSKFDVSVHMYIMTKVAKTFLNSIVIFSTPLIAFSLCFYIVSVSNKPDKVDSPSSDESGDFNSFDDLGIALVKTFVMMTGEFDASNFKFNENLPILIVFILYVFFGFMVIFNILNALAVNDTNEIKSEGQLIDLLQKIEWLSKHTSILENNKRLREFFCRKSVETESPKESNVSKSNKCIVHLRFKKKNEEVTLEYGNYIRQLPMSEDLFRKFHCSLEKKEKTAAKKEKKEKLENIYKLLMKIQPSLEKIDGNNYSKI